MCAFFWVAMETPRRTWSIWFNPSIVWPLQLLGFTARFINQGKRLGTRSCQSCTLSSFSGFLQLGRDRTYRAGNGAIGSHAGSFSVGLSGRFIKREKFGLMGCPVLLSSNPGFLHIGRKRIYRTGLERLTVWESVGKQSTRLKMLQKTQQQQQPQQQQHTNQQLTNNFHYVLLALDKLMVLEAVWRSSFSFSKAFTLCWLWLLLGDSKNKRNPRTR